MKVELYRKLNDGTLREATEEDIKTARGQINVAKRQNARGAKVWKKHSVKAGKACRCPACNARRNGEPFYQPEERGPVRRSYAVRSNYVR